MIMIATKRHSDVGSNINVNTTMRFNIFSSLASWERRKASLIFALFSRRMCEGKCMSFSFYIFLSDMGIEYREKRRPSKAHDRRLQWQILFP